MSVAFINNQFHGHGLRTWSGWTSVCRGVQKRVQHGQGTEIWLNGTSTSVSITTVIGMDMEFTCGKTEEKYVGEFKKNKKHGMGTMTALSGEEHIGEFQNDKFHGEGVHIWA